MRNSINTERRWRKKNMRKVYVVLFLWIVWAARIKGKCLRGFFFAREQQKKSLLTLSKLRIRKRGKFCDRRHWWKTWENGSENCLGGESETVDEAMNLWFGAELRFWFVEMFKGSRIVLEIQSFVTILMLTLSQLRFWKENKPKLNLTRFLSQNFNNFSS